MIPLWLAIVYVVGAFALGCFAGVRVADHYHLKEMNEIKAKIDALLVRMKYGASGPLHIDDQGNDP